MLRRWLVVILAVVSLFVVHTTAEAAGVEKLRVNGVVKFTHLSSSGVNVWLSVSNNTKHRLVLKRGSVDFMVGGRHVVTVSLRDKVVVRRGTRDVLVPLRFESHTSFALVWLLREIVSDANNIYVEYDLRAGTALLRKSIKSENGIALSKILDNFAISKDDINALLRLL